VAEGARSVRLRILAAVLGLTALGMTVAGAQLTAIQLSRIDERITASLAQEIAEIRGFVEGDDPVTGRPWADLPSVLQAGVEGQVPDENQEVLALIDGEVAFRPRESLPPDVANHPEVLVEVAQVTSPEFGQTVVEPVGTIRWAVLPVRVEGDPRQGLLVTASLVQPERDELFDALRTYALASVLTLVVVGVVGWTVSGRLLRPLREVRETAERITESDLTERITVSGSDEVSALAATFNRMLDRLEAAFVNQRQFLDDAGHELRTPLTVVRGHLEIMDEGDPDDVAASRTLVLDELDRMSRLVDDMVLLAKSARPDFVHVRVVEVGALVDEVLDKSRALASRHWLLDRRADARLLADPQRLTQALLQLVSNAVRYTGEGDVVALGSRVDHGAVRIWVRDSGPGVRPEDAERIFERFERGAGAEGEGSGLGLAIVRAIAEAHGARAFVEPVPDGGARFVLLFPAHRRLPEDPSDVVEQGRPPTEVPTRDEVTVEQVVVR
jgi:signal transduction histidine kinase